MTSEQRDPREAVLVCAYGMTAPGRAEAMLARLNAADPLRAILPEVVEALEKIQALTGHMDSTAEEVTEAWKLSREALARLRETHPTTGGTDDGE